ncbi:MAG: hypothetical protein ACM35G_01875 [Planctomycetaceae bacterium]
MFKKALQVAMSFGLLLACYEGYTRAFKVAAESLSRSRKGVELAEFHPSQTGTGAIDLAERAFGKDHWSTSRDLPIRYYSKERGYWMYARDYKRLKDGKQLQFEPFALIWQSRDGKGLKTALSQKAVIDLDQPLGLSKPDGSTMHVKHATIVGDVRLRDDKATPRDPSDDLSIGPLPYVEYDEPTLQIRSESDVVIQDRDMWITGFGMLITLRPKDESDPSNGTGFNGAKSAFLQKDVHIIINDVGRSGVLPGTAKAEQVQGTKTPLDLRCAGQMQVDLPKPRLPVRVGPPAPPLPTLAMFDRDVVVLRGKLGETPDQLNCDHLRLVLLPTPKPPAPTPAPAPAPQPGGASGAPAPVAVSVEAAPAPAAKGPLTELALRRAEATGHAVWLRSESQGMKALGNELIYEKFAPEAPDRTFFMGDATKKLRVEKIDYATTGPEKGKVQSVTTIWAIDATIFDNGQGSGTATVIARGPGLLETRPDRDKPVERRAIWQDALEMVTVTGPDQLPRKKITLTGRPQLIDPTQATLDARDRVIAWLRPKPKPGPTPVAAATAPTPASTTESFQIERMFALDDVHLNAPGRTMTARDRLDVEFDLLSRPTGVQADRAPAVPVPEAAPAPAEPAPNAPAPPPQPAPKPAEPNISVKANRVWAKVLQQPGQSLAVASNQGPGSEGDKAQIQEVRLRGAVAFHQDPAPDKKRGTDITGEALDTLSLGDGKSEFKVFHQDPTDPKARPNPRAPRAKVETEDFSIEGPVIGLNQKTDRAWVNGPGSLTQMAQRGLLTDKGLDNPPADAKARAKGQPEAPPKQVPLKISWKTSMKFFGQSTDPQGQRVARAEFATDVRAEMEDALLLCQEMKTYMDRAVTLARPPKGKAKAADDGIDAPAEEPKPQIGLIDCYGGDVGDEYRQVIAVSRKLDPDTRALLQQQQIEGEHILYDKRTGNFHVPGAGLVYLYNREGQDAANGPLGAPATVSRPTVTPIADPNPPAANARRATTIVGRNSSRSPAVETPKAVLAKPERAPLPPLKLTQISFGQAMKGRFGTAKGSEKAETRWADFFGDVQVLNGQVASERETFDFDLPPPDGVFLTAQMLRVVSDPTSGGADGSARHFLKAWESAYATTNDKTIQADIITYDSLNDLFYAYGTEGREVLIAQQGQVGQPYSTTGGSALRYNHKTGESTLIDPRTVQLVDKAGGRPQPIKPSDLPKEKEPKSSRAPFKKQGSSTTERKGFNGR